MLYVLHCLSRSSYLVVGSSFPVYSYHKKLYILFIGRMRTLYPHGLNKGFRLKVSHYNRYPKKVREYSTPKKLTTKIRTLIYVSQCIIIILCEKKNDTKTTKNYLVQFKSVCQRQHLNITNINIYFI